ncbi:TetR/AcrR family transcriptional regulator [Ktedonosporobacter rubrisoli]|uniref:TetR/AcrR family transcriptional regulator n=1 Tax=Ktedonosporobacter rubrisoli TaxID=2509675 RepID=A0A4P6JLA7_KTERU|nr:TetR/AcrR family transcriptional regulator [Ktedonosporobacter rubrisoli]QBD75989.1 TetR/AcrR family transcriptional regulator [Ktedonosporobacter rubrisoli]
MDRRVRKTREAIMGAFIELLSEKSFEDITMNEIAERADVNRGTVYLHYVDKFDLMDRCIETQLTRLFESCLDSKTAPLPSKVSLLHTFEYLEQHAVLFRMLLVNKGIPAFNKRLAAGIQQHINEYIDMYSNDLNVSKELLAQFLTSAIIGVLEWWVMHSMPLPAQDVVEQLWSLQQRLQVVLPIEA